LTYTGNYDTLTLDTNQETAPRPKIGLHHVHSEFNASTIEAGLNFGAEHTTLTALFVAALATKPFVILSGLSGSGKTLLATTFGQWLGRDQLLLQPVRPDWTSPEMLLGYEDRLSETLDSLHGWQVPRTLDFILKAAHDPERPYVLVLDEMNLAHVEQYFADVLSGMESNQPVIPNLQRDAHGWRMPPRDAQYLPWPKNIFTIGTINVDETTYTFSPKVLDRASLVEFRVSPDAIRLDYPKQQPVIRADSRIANAFLKRALGDEQPWTGRESVGSALQTLHGILYQHQAEFGHRVVRESLRFAAMMNEVGVSDTATIVDLIFVQRIMPKLETSNLLSQRLLEELTAFTNARLPKSSARLQRLANTKH
jgi:5-methylcytosine-specific restriction enzyme B